MVTTMFDKSVLAGKGEAFPEKVATTEKPHSGISMREIRRAAGKQKRANRLKVPQLSEFFGLGRPEAKDRKDFPDEAQEDNPSDEGGGYMSPGG